MTQIKIAFTGVHGSGKTTKVKQLENRMNDIGKTNIVVSEIARKCPYHLMTIKSQEWIWHEQMMNERRAMSQYADVIICDRTVMDNLMYYRAVIEEPINRRDWNTNFVRWHTLYQQAKAWMATYSQVIRLPLNLEWLQSNDPIRLKDVNYARIIDRLFDQFVDPFVTQWGYDLHDY